MNKLVITESHTDPAKPEIGLVRLETREEEYGSFQLAAHQFGLAMDYWANRGSIIKDANTNKFTCHIAQGFWVTIELV